MSLALSPTVVGLAERLLGRLARAVACGHRSRDQSPHHRPLHELDDRLLRDIGLDPHQVRLHSGPGLPL